jgi:hypothetical protein
VNAAVFNTDPLFRSALHYLPPDFHLRTRTTTYIILNLTTSPSVEQTWSNMASTNPPANNQRKDDTDHTPRSVRRKVADAPACVYSYTEYAVPC